MLTALQQFLKPLGHTWYIIHRNVNSAVLVLSLVGLAASVLFTMWKADAVHFAVIGNNPHAPLGLAIVIAMLLQAALGIYANRSFDPTRKGTPLFPDMTHQWLGRVTILAGYVNCFFGLWLLNDDVFSLATLLYAALVLVAVGMLVAGTCHMGSARHTHGDDRIQASLDGEAASARDLEKDMERTLLNSATPAGKHRAQTAFSAAAWTSAALAVLALAIVVVSEQKIGANLFFES